MKTKICFKCNTEKDLSDFYVHKQMVDGHLNKCKSCTKNDTKKRTDKLSNDLEWVEKEKTRHREKYHKLEYRGKWKQSPERKKITMDKYFNRFPEKKSATYESGKIPALIEVKHHWSYNKEHYKDVIHLTKEHHYKAHRFIIYDQERMMYRRIDNMELLDTKDAHEDYINMCIEKF